MNATAQFTSRSSSVNRPIVEPAYPRYCWPVRSIEDRRLPPFDFLAPEGELHGDRNHLWHMEKTAELCGADNGLLPATPLREVDITGAHAVCGTIRVTDAPGAKLSSPILRFNSGVRYCLFVGDNVLVAEAAPRNVGLVLSIPLQVDTTGNAHFENANSPQRRPGGQNRTLPYAGTRKPDL